MLCNSIILVCRVIINMWVQWKQLFRRLTSEFHIKERQNYVILFDEQDYDYFNCTSYIKSSILIHWQSVYHD